MKFNSGLDMQGNEIKLSAPEYVSELPNTNLFKGRTVMVVIPGVAPNPDTGMLYYYNGTQWILLDQSESFNCFHGTSIQWNALSDGQKAAYDYVDLTDEEDKVITLNLTSKGNIHRKSNPALTADANDDCEWVIDDIALENNQYPQINIYEHNTGELVLTDVSVDFTSEEITIGFKGTGDISSGKYVAVLVV